MVKHSHGLFGAPLFEELPEDAQNELIDLARQNIESFTLPYESIEQFKEMMDKRQATQEGE